jgi:predicted tellurium resistance membrane protein TerC
MIKSGYEMVQDAYFNDIAASSKGTNIAKKAAPSLISSILQITAVDFVFSFDSIITAIGMSNNIPAIVTAIIISRILMIYASEYIGRFLQEYPALKIIALAFIFMVGVILLGDGFYIHISKGYLYFSLFFTLIVEILNISAKKRH